MDRTIDEMIDFLIFEKGEDILVNGIIQKALLFDVSEKPDYYNDKIIQCKSILATGDIVEYNNLRYIITSQIEKDENSYRARIRKCSHRIAFNWLGNIRWFDCIEESKVFDISTGKFMSEALGNIFITVQYNSDTKNIALNQKFYVTNQPFKVTGIDKSQEGLIKYNCALDLISKSDDDVENNIVARWKYEVPHTYTLTIINGDTANVLINNIIQLNLSATDNGTAVVNPVVTYTSSDPNIVSVDNTGKVMGISLGQAVISVKLTYHNTIYDSITITTAEILTHSYSIDITGSTSIKVGQNQSYIAHIYDNGSEVFDKSVVWIIYNQDGTTDSAYATITTSAGNAVTIKGSDNPSHTGKYIILRSELPDDSLSFKEFTIQVKSIF